MKKILTLIIIFIGLFCLTSCESNEKLEAPLKELENLNYTFDVEVVSSSISKNKDGEINTDNNSYKIYTEVNSDKMYCIETKNSESTYYYVYIKREKLEPYIEEDGYWLYVSESFAKAVTYNRLIYTDYSAFKKDIRGIWVGDVNKIYNHIKVFFKDEIESSESYGYDLDINLKKYNVIVENNQVKMIDIEYLIVINIDGKTIKGTSKLSFVFSNIGNTEVTVPERFRY